MGTINRDLRLVMVSPPVLQTRSICAAVTGTAKTALAIFARIGNTPMWEHHQGSSSKSSISSSDRVIDLYFSISFWSFGTVAVGLLVIFLSSSSFNNSLFLLLLTGSAPSLEPCSFRPRWLEVELDTSRLISYSPAICVTNETSDTQFVRVLTGYA